MFVQLRRMTVAKGHADQVIERFSKPGIIEQQEGFVDIKIMQKKQGRGEEEVIVMITWESETHWKQWEKSDVHIAGHRANRGKSKPDYMLNMELGMYEVKAAKKAAGKAEISE
ncbi:antibiotic biosynthesis monooxygenase [Weizmannia coagulans]|nr:MULTISPECIES: antibiotic biosynthesis monooxygenase [Heyndrickxia]ATW82658.1 antibiotic biosynthesis monooxygenase [Heyndrickxia coagulans]KGB28931.1 antibiotic biosynthesis monooxygenase [Heyndrickxia coagulans]KXT21580.1 antibiotic biosynthesis monooxygenase [Heyndrickxia coagulans]MBT2194552.1 antibiotic biosynthesis monooxygenase [Heyndrickxia coagulans]MBT2236786.1 antibiotic biosynthesis monooxygenase [Heyndrickxia coagulans]